MKLFAQLFKRIMRKQRVDAPAAVPVPASTPASAPRKLLRKRSSKKRRVAPGARKIDPNGPLIEQARKLQGKQ
ncbi:hypothetical protein ACQCRI_15125 [Ralstonia pseudosolanacearum]|uniref:hypothetical protein n=1 Tax=Ralstonia pseudosolanacearum TaxID=1310165 RepID=UPI0011C45F10|nr:hypothetical protein [Ralstonia sp. RS647]QKL61879.1 hypothetical protein HI812_09545 [Ralstonia solanacearum]QKL66680.1 hypothetical protein HI808_09545 [Ralstonia solanacearum]QKM42912.1 hypothetical protein HI792_09485 [Ralstonia solanacearum]UZF36543.1 hypothetical protein LGV81_07825 [Ralstonia sp. RS647]